LTCTIITVDDEMHNLMLLESYLEGTGHAVKYFTNGSDALDCLQSGCAADTILLDRMMPGMDGLTFMRELRKLKAHLRTPVIMQTAAVGSAEVAEGITAGAYYYLAKPFARDVLLAVVARALADYAFHAGLEQTAVQFAAGAGHVERMQLSFSTLDDVRTVSFFLASCFPDPNSAMLGITELMLNAVEHGNLGITYAEKSELMHVGGWQDEVGRRLLLPENIAKRARVSFERDVSGLTLTIEDMGAGFNWDPFTEFDINRAGDSHGRGIAMSRMISFDDVTYTAPGNKVICRKRL
jgi:CheY-like chemotaxis protein